MTTVKATHEGNNYRIEIQGHTRSDLCHGISALTCTLSGILHADSDVVIHSNDLKPGECVIDIDSDSEFASHAVDFAVIGMMIMQNQYPDQIRIEKNYLTTESQGEN